MERRHERCGLQALGLHVAIVCACACGKSRDAQSEPPAGSVAVAIAPSRSSVHESPDAGGARTGPATAWTGSYESAPGGLYIPPDWKSVSFVVKDTEAGLGHGTLAFRVEPPAAGVVGGLVIGTIDGPLGPAAIDGRAGDGEVTATIFRRDPADQGFAGTLVGAMAGDRAEGTINVSLGDAHAIRRATFVAKSDHPGH